jgi:hypothetical protein
MAANPTAVIPYSEMERMATTVAKSGLFGVKDKDQALALMALSQAEGIHPMTAVRDFHIIQGRASMKADTMLARFQRAGGNVEWHELNDTKADATVTPPPGRGPAWRMDWTIDRARLAGLTNKDIWKGYPRAMLRSRLISEAIRTLFPSIISGAYTPEELQSIDPELPDTVEQRLQAFDQPVLTQATVVDYLKDIKDAPTVETLKDNFGAAWKAAKEKGDEQRMATLKTAYDARKAELETPPPVLTLVEDPAPAEQSEAVAS